MDFRIAVKAFIVKNNKLLLIQRPLDAKHKPGGWDIPGGRLELGEDPFSGLKREVSEEIGVKSLDIKFPLQIQHFTGDDGQNITMLIFLATFGEEKIVLSAEHIEYKWVSLETSGVDGIPDWLKLAFKNYKDFELGSKV